MGYLFSPGAARSHKVQKNAFLFLFIMVTHCVWLLSKKKKSINVFNKLPNAHVWVYWERGCLLLKFPESCWVHLAIASSQQGNQNCLNRLSGQSQNQIINTLLRKHIGFAAGRGELDVRLVAKLKITFISPPCHNLRQERKHWQVGLYKQHRQGRQGRCIGNPT